MLYMFSGPDFLYATSFFPNASTYVLAGLEPVGAVPELTSLSPLIIDEELALKPILAATPARSISLPRPATVNGAPLSERK